MSEVPATNDPTIIHWVRHEQSGQMLPVHGPAEVPADEGMPNPDRSHFRTYYASNSDGEFQEEDAAEFDRWLAAELQKSRAEAVKGELTEFRHRAQAAFEWPNPEHAMSTLAEIEFEMLAERFPVQEKP